MSINPFLRFCFSFTFALLFPAFPCRVQAQAHPKTVAETLQTSALYGPVVNPSNGHIYYLLDGMAWTDAEAKAVALGGHLATIRNAQEEDWVFATFSNLGGVSRDLWIGLNDAKTTNQYVWASGETANYRHWAGSQPDHDHNIEHWAGILRPGTGGAGFWNDFPNAGYISPPRPLYGVAEIVPLAGPIVNHANDHIYYLLDGMPWTVAQSVAVAMGGNLATVRNAQEEDWIYATFATFGGKNRDLWIGINDAQITGHYVWASGEQTAYTHWGKGQPDHNLGVEHYGEIILPGLENAGYWNDYPEDGNNDSSRRIYGVVEVIPGQKSPAEVRQSKAFSLRDKTMVVWVALNDNSQQGGSAFTIETLSPRFDGAFDSVVFGERKAQAWMLGSDDFLRTERDQSAYPTDGSRQKFERIAAVCESDHVTLYCDSQVLASYRMPNPPATFGSDAAILIGLRHLARRGQTGAYLSGEVEEARLYDRALTAEEVKALQPNSSAGPKPLGCWTFEDGTARDTEGNFFIGTLNGGAVIRHGKLVLNGVDAFMSVLPVTVNPTPISKTIHEAADRGDLLAIERFVAQDAKAVNAVDNGTMPLHHAAWSNQLEATKFLVEHGADINARQGDGATPLLQAASRQNNAVAKYLLEHGANPNIAGNVGTTPLHNSALHGDIDLVRLLLDYGADPNPHQTDGGTPLLWATQQGHTEVARMIQAKINERAAGRVSGRTPAPPRSQRRHAASQRTNACQAKLWHRSGAGRGQPNGSACPPRPEGAAHRDGTRYAGADAARNVHRVAAPGRPPRLRSRHAVFDEPVVAVGKEGRRRRQSPALLRCGRAAWRPPTGFERVGDGRASENRRPDALRPDRRPIGRR